MHKVIDSSKEPQFICAHTDVAFLLIRTLSLNYQKSFIFAKGDILSIYNLIFLNRYTVYISELMLTCVSVKCLDSEHSHKPLAHCKYDVLRAHLCLKLPLMVKRRTAIWIFFWGAKSRRRHGDEVNGSVSGKTRKTRKKHNLRGRGHTLTFLRRTLIRDRLRFHSKPVSSYITVHYFPLAGPRFVICLIWFGSVSLL